MSLHFLADTDLIQPEDWCRHMASPSTWLGDQSGNQFQWRKVKHQLGECWFNKPISTLRTGHVVLSYEFLRGGDPPKAHQYIPPLHA